MSTKTTEVKGLSASVLTLLKTNIHLVKHAEMAKHLAQGKSVSTFIYILYTKTNIVAQPNILYHTSAQMISSAIRQYGNMVFHENKRTSAVA